MRKRLLDSITEYLYSRSQKAQTAEERDGFTLALAIMGAVRRLEPDPFQAACYSAFGSTLELYLKRRARQQWTQHQELVACIPDYDPAEMSTVSVQKVERLNHAQVVQAGEVRGREAGPGRVHQMPEPPQPAVQKPLRSVPRAPTARDA